jgi:hypothetical protein
VLVLIVGLYAIGFLWMRKLATFAPPERLLAGPGPVAPADQPDHVTRGAR